MNAFIGLGIAVISGILCGRIMNKFKIPAVAGYILAGLLIGTSGFKLINNNMLNQLSFLNDLALGIIAFNIGSELKLSVIKKLGKSIFIIAICEATGAFVLVTGIMLLLHQSVPTALILGAVSSATAPAATVMVLNEIKAKGPLTSTLLGVVAVDDAICLMIYAIASSIAKVFISHESITLYKVLLSPIIEIILSIAIGVVIGTIMSYLVKHSKTETELISFVVIALLLLIGVTVKLKLSTLLAAMASGIAVANISSRSRKVFGSIQQLSPPIIIGFFTLAGCRLDISLIPKLGLIGSAYLLFRILGKVLGAMLGGFLSKAPKTVQQNIGFGLLSQVGVAIGLAVSVGKEFPGTKLGTIVITILLATTIITEIIGPIATKHAIIKAKEANI